MKGNWLDKRLSWGGVWRLPAVPKGIAIRCAVLDAELFSLTLACQ